MNDVQIATTCDLIIETYPYYKLEDFKLCFKNSMRHKNGYDKLYDRLDGAIIMDWLKVYDNERTEAGMNMSDNEIKQIECSNTATYEEYLEYLKNKADSGDEKAMQSLIDKKNGDWICKKPDYLAYKLKREKRFKNDNRNK